MPWGDASGRAILEGWGGQCSDDVQDTARQDIEWIMDPDIGTGVRHEFGNSTATSSLVWRYANPYARRSRGG
jgi:hypothetical protein